MGMEMLILLEAFFVDLVGGILPFVVPKRSLLAAVVVVVSVFVGCCQNFCVSICSSC